jgi:hypothetical protein
MLSPLCGRAVALRDVGKQHLVSPEVAGALTKTATRGGRQVAILRLCCTLVARVEITSYECMQKNCVAVYSGMHLIFVWLLISYQ